MEKHKNAYLKPNEVCEYNHRCSKCNGRNHNWQNRFSCGLRRGLLICDGYKIIWSSGGK